MHTELAIEVTHSFDHIGFFYIWNNSYYTILCDATNAVEARAFSLASFPLQCKLDTFLIGEMSKVFEGLEGEDITAWKNLNFGNWAWMFGILFRTGKWWDYLFFVVVGDSMNMFPRWQTCAFIFLIGLRDFCSRVRRFSLKGSLLIYLRVRLYSPEALNNKSGVVDNLPNVELMELEFEDENFCRYSNMRVILLCRKAVYSGYHSLLYSALLNYYQNEK